jgi:hypothetical protein
MGTAVLQEEIQAIWLGLCEGIHEPLEALGIQIRQLQEEPLAGGGFHGTIDIEPLKNML